MLKNGLLTMVVTLASGCTAQVDGTPGTPSAPSPGTKSHTAGGDDISSLALANLNVTACGTNSLGDGSFFSSCTGNGGAPEYWCADFARWVWNGVGFDTSELTAAAGSFYV